MTAIDYFVNRLRGEFLEMPGLRLTPDQVRRLCGVEATLCQQVLDVLVESKFLCVKSGGMYARTSGDEVSDQRVARAGTGIGHRYVS